jgi:restriction endonuclease S subunit
MNISLPNGWAWARFGDFWLLAQNGCGSRRGTGSPTVVLRLADVSVEGSIAEESLREVPLSDAEREKYGLEPGDLLAFRVNGSTQITGQVICYPGPVGYVFCDHFIRFRLPREAFEPRFVAWAFKVPLIRNQVATRMVSTAGQNTVSQATYADVQLSISPLSEQRRIVDALESYFSRLDDAVATLERVQRNLKRYRASVLKAAVEGRLVPIEAELARTEGRDYEPASVLLERILTERRRRWEISGRKGKYHEPIVPDPKDLPELPEGWCWSSPGQFFSWSSGSFLPKSKQRAGSIPVYGGNGVNGYHDEPLVKEPTLVIGRVGAHCGNVHLTVEPAWITDNAIFAAVVPNEAVLAYWRLIMSLQDLNANAGGTGQPYVNQKHLNDLVIPLPPRAEQLRIVSAIDDATSLVDASNRGVEAAAGRSARLRQAILKWAFEGRLADQDSNDEPASILLERIKAEREAVGASGKSARARRGRRKGRAA